MKQNAYNLSELLDLALRVPEIGAVNFNILYIVLQTTISELGLKEVKPWCHIETPISSKAALTQAKLESKQQISSSRSFIPPPARRLDPIFESAETTSDEALPPAKDKQTHTPPTEEKVVEEDKESQISSKDQEHKISGKDSASESVTSKSKDTLEKAPARKISASEVEKRELPPGSATERATLEGKHTSKQEEPKDREGSTSEVEKQEKPLKTPNKLATSKTKGSSEKDLKDTASAPEAEKQESSLAPIAEQATSKGEDTEKQKTPDKEVLASEVQKQEKPLEKPSKQATSKSKDISKKDLDDTASASNVEEPESTSAPTADEETSEGEDMPKQEIAVKDSPSKIKKHKSTSSSETEQPTSKGKDTSEQKQTETSSTSGRQDRSSAPRSKGETSEDKEIPKQEGKSKEDAETSKQPRKKFSRGGADLEEASAKLKTQKDSFTEFEDKRKKPRDRNVAQNWHYTYLESRVEAAEEGIMRLTDIVDLLTEKLRKRESQRKPGGPTAAEFEAFEDRIMSLEEAREECEHDHLKLEDIESNLDTILSEFEKIQALGGNFEKMEDEMSKKADLEDMLEALSQKADVEEVNKKVDRVEFETAIEELGEAIGVLGIKFTTKNTEWEGRAKELWKAIDGKMSRDIFDKNTIKTEERIMALMLRLKEIKDILQVLYPDACGVTYCFSCKRPADISGHKCIPGTKSPKRPYKLSAESEEEATEKLLEEVNQHKMPRLDGPPYTLPKDVIISVPYNSTTYNSTTDESDIEKSRQLILSPVNKNMPAKRNSEALKLPKLTPLDSNKTNSSKDSLENQVQASKLGNKKMHRELLFTNRRLAELDRRNAKENPKTNALSLTPEEPFKSESFTSISTRPLSSESSDAGVISDSSNIMRSFAPLKMMQDPLRRDISLSGTSQQQNRPKMMLSPLKPKRKSSYSSSD